MSSLQARPTRILTRVLTLTNGSDPNLHRGPFLTPSLTPTLTRTRRELLTPTLTLTRRELPTHVPIGEVGLRRRALLRRAGKPRQAAGGDGTTAEAGLLRTSAEWGQGRGGHLDPLSLSGNLPRCPYQDTPTCKPTVAATRPRFT